MKPIYILQWLMYLWCDYNNNECMLSIFSDFQIGKGVENGRERR